MLSKFDPNVTYQSIISFDLNPTNTDCQLECVFLTAETCSIVWEKRQSNKRMEVNSVKATIRARVESLQKSACFGSNGTNLLAMIEVDKLPQL